MSRDRLSLLAIVATTLLAGCGHYRLALAPPPLGAQAVSFLGDTLWSVRYGHAEAQERVTRLMAAQRRALAEPGNDAATILLGRRTAEMGRFREALEIYSEGLERDWGDARLFRRRGELLLLLREPEKAVRELQQALKRTVLYPDAKEFTETDDGEFVGTRVRYGTLLLLGVAHHIRGDRQAAVNNLTEAARAAVEPDEVAAAMAWLYLTLRRAGRNAEAQEVLGVLPADYEVTHRRAELRMLLALRGELSFDSLRREIATTTDRSVELVYLYGLAVTMEAAGRPEEARALLEEIRRTGFWADVVAVAAEADLARLAAPCPGDLPFFPADRRWIRCRLRRQRIRNQPNGRAAASEGPADPSSPPAS